MAGVFHAAVARERSASTIRGCSPARSNDGAHVPVHPRLRRTQPTQAEQCVDAIGAPGPDTAVGERRVLVAGGDDVVAPRRTAGRDQMKSLIDFVKTTVFGGVVFLVPLAVLAFFAAKGVHVARVVAEPMARWVPVDSVAGVTAANLVAGMLIVALCFVAGIVARVSLASRLVAETEARILWRLPGYAMVKSVADGVAGADDATLLSPVLARLDDAAQVAFEVERLSDGRVVVFLPGAPDPWSGSVLVMTPDRIEPLAVPVMAVVQNLRRLGGGSAALLSRSPAAAS